MICVTYYPIWYKWPKIFSMLQKERKTWPIHKWPLEKTSQQDKKGKYRGFRVINIGKP